MEKQVLASSNDTGLSRRQVMEHGAVALIGTAVLSTLSASRERHNAGPQNVGPELRDDERHFLTVWQDYFWTSKKNELFLRPRQIFCGNVSALAMVYLKDDSFVNRLELGNAGLVAIPPWPWRDRQEFEERLCHARVRLCQEKELAPAPDLPVLADRIGVRLAEVCFLVRLSHELSHRCDTHCEWSGDFRLFPAHQKMTAFFGENTWRNLPGLNNVFHDLTGVDYLQMELMSQDYAPLECPWANHGEFLQFFRGLLEPRNPDRVTPDHRKRGEAILEELMANA